MPYCVYPNLLSSMQIMRVTLICQVTVPQCTCVTNLRVSLYRLYNVPQLSSIVEWGQLKLASSRVQMTTMILETILRSQSVILIFGIMGEVSLAVVQLMAWAWLWGCSAFSLCEIVIVIVSSFLVLQRAWTDGTLSDIAGLIGTPLAYSTEPPANLQRTHWPCRPLKDVMVVEEKGYYMVATTSSTNYTCSG